MEMAVEFDVETREWVLIPINGDGMAATGGTDEAGSYVNAYRIPTAEMQRFATRERVGK